MTSVTLDLTDRARAVAERVGKPGTEESKAAHEILGIAPEESRDSLSPTELFEALADMIETRASAIGYRKAAQERTAEDRAFARVARRRSAKVVKARIAEGC